MEPAVLSHAATTSFGDQGRATGWSATVCMEMSFHESPKLQVSMLSPERDPSEPVSRASRSASPAPLVAPAGMTSRNS